MLKVAFLANEFPAAVEPYVADEIEEFQRRGIAVIAGSVIRPRQKAECAEIVVRPVGMAMLFRAVWLFIWRYNKISDLLARVLLRGPEGPMRRAKALLHTFWGACYAVHLREKQVHHIHVHHGFSASWIAMVAARLLGVNFSMTLYGSDLLLERAYMDVKLENCSFCVNISEYNRGFILTHYPQIDADKVIMVRLGVDIPESVRPPTLAADNRDEVFRIVTVGRLHPVKDHEFLVRACAKLRDLGLNFECEIGGDGPERQRLQALIRELRLEDKVTLLGFRSTEEIWALYERGDVVALTSRSEGIPLVLMEAMARGKIVLAPAITGIPELVIPGKTGFLYEPGSMNDFVRQIITIYSADRNLSFPGRAECEASEPQSYPLRGRPPLQVAGLNPLDWVSHAARLHVRHYFNREKNLQMFTDLFLQRVQSAATEDIPHASSLLQQI